MTVDGSRQLLDDVLNDGALFQFRTGLESRCLEQVALKRRRIVLARAMCLAAALLPIIAGMFFLMHRLQRTSLEIITTNDARQGLPVVESFTTASVSSSDGFAAQAVDRIRSVPLTIPQISDDELLGGFDEQPRALMKDRTGDERLVFLDPLDDDLFYGRNAPEYRL